MLPTEQQAAIHAERAGRLVDEGRVNDAIAELAEAIRFDGRQALAWQLLAEIYGAAGYHEPAASYAQKCLQEDYSNIKAWVMLANTYAQIGGAYTELAIEQIDMALAIDENNADLYYIKGNIYAQRADIARAREYYTKALECSPTHIYAKYDLDKLPPA